MSSEAPLRSTSDRLIVAGTAVLLALALGLLIASWRYIDARGGSLTEQDLRTHVDGLAARCNAWSAAWGERLHIEAAWVSAHDSMDTEAAVDRWRTLMDAYWPVLEVRLADEAGNELALLRNDTSFVLRQTVEGSANGPPVSMLIEPLLQDSSLARTWIDSVDRDPRKQAWFGQSLRNRSIDPAWTLADDVPGAMCIAQMIRPHDPEGRFRILQITIDPARTGTEILGHLHQGGQWSMVMLPGEHEIANSPTVDVKSDPVLRGALAHWRGARSTAPFTVEVGSGKYRCWFEPHELNGVQFIIGGIVPYRAQEELVRPARAFVVLGLVIIALLGALLLVAYARKRRDLLHLRREQEHAEAQQARLVKALGERDVLDRETHHRVKNNLQVVSSMLNLQAQRLDEGPVKSEFLRGKQRIDTMALVHHKLYGMPDLRGVDLRTFFDDLVRSVRGNFEPRSSTVSFQVDTAGLRADTDTAIELGIILCELVANCYQHAFPYATGGHIDVTVTHVEKDLHLLTVKDNGVGLGAHDGRDKAKLGLEIVEALAGQLDGTFRMRSEGGVTFEVGFRMQPLAVAPDPGA